MQLTEPQHSSHSTSQLPNSGPPIVPDWPTLNSTIAVTIAEPLFSSSPQASTIEDYITRSPELSTIFTNSPQHKTDYHSAADNITHSSSYEYSTLPAAAATGLITTTSAFIESTTTPFSTGKCSECPNMIARPDNSAGSYNGMIVLDHYSDGSSCRVLDIDCRPATADEFALLSFGSMIVAYTPGSIHHTMTCTAEGTWIYEGQPVDSVSCIVKKAVGPVDPSPPTVVTEPPQPTTTTTVAPGVDPCRTCSRLTVMSLTSPEYANGFTTLLNGNNGACNVVELTCEGNTPTDELALLMPGTELMRGTGNLTMKLTCNKFTMWTSEQSFVVPHIGCGIVQRTTITMTTTTPISTSTSTTVTTELVQTTTTDASAQCNACDNLEATQPAELDQDEDIGTLVLDHYNEPQTNCRVVVVRCKGENQFENATILFNGNIVASSSSYQVSSSLTCTSEATWIRLGEQIKSAACKVSRSPAGVITPLPPSTEPTTPEPTQPGTLPCSTCNRMFVTGVLPGYRSGFLTMDTYNTGPGQCLGVYLSCVAPRPGSDVAIVASNGDQLVCETDRVNMTMNCNDEAEWVAQTGAVIDTLSCGEVVATTATTTTTTSLAPSQCNACDNLEATQPAELDQDEDIGTLVLDHYNEPQTNCRVVVVRCRGDNQFENLTILFNGNIQVSSAPYQVSSSLTCSPDGTWMRLGQEIQSAACKVTKLPTEVTTPLPPPTTTTTPEPTQPGALPCSTCNRMFVTGVPSGYRSGFLTMDTYNTDGGQCLGVYLSCAAPTSGQEAAIVGSSGDKLASSLDRSNLTLNCNEEGQWISTEGKVVDTLSCGEVIDETEALTTTTTPSPSLCNSCENMVAVPPSVLGPDEDVGTLVLDHYKEPQTNCRVVVVRCRGENQFENMTIYFNGDIEAASAPYQVSNSLTCTSAGTWMRLGQEIVSAACKVTKLPPDVATPAPEPTTTTMPVPTQPGAIPCSTCNRMFVSGVPSGYRSGFLTMDTYNTDGGQCLGVSLSCAAPTPGQEASIVGSAGDELASSLDRTNLTLNCNEEGRWISTEGKVVDTLSCGEELAATTTTTTTTSPAPSLCNSCENMVAVPPSVLGPDEDVGTLVLDHYKEPQTNCRVVVVRCRGENQFENMTIYFNGDVEAASAHYQVSNSLTCTSAGTWMRLGDEISSAACKVSKLPPDVATPAPEPTTSTTTEPPLPGALPCSTCNRMFVTGVPSGYRSGFLTMDTYNTDGGQCLGVYLSCAAPTLGQEAAIVGSSGDKLIGGVDRTNLTLNCNEEGRWISTEGKVVDTLSCGEVIVTTTVTTTTVATTTTTTQPTPFETTSPSCDGSVWDTWREWSECSDTCGSCGTHQRFRACNKTMPTCLCSGTAYEKEPCNLQVCKYPRTSSCCDGFKAASANGMFQCMPIT